MVNNRINAGPSTKLMNAGLSARPPSCGLPARARFLARWRFYGLRRRRKALMLGAVFLVLASLSIRCSEPFPEVEGLDYLLLVRSAIDSDTRKFVFLTNNGYTGNLKGTYSTGIEGADAICAQEKAANFFSLPGAGSDYKAMLSSSTRVACTSSYCSGGSSEHTNWILAANTEYYNSSGQLLMTTNGSGIVDFGSGASLNQPFTTAVSFYWTGLQEDWRLNADTCSDWTVEIAGLPVAGLGAGSVTNNTSLGFFGQNDQCSKSFRFLCVRQ